MEKKPEIEDKNIFISTELVRNVQWEGAKHKAVIQTGEGHVLVKTGLSFNFE